MPRAAGHRRPGERRLPGDQARPDPVPAGRVREARDHRLPRELPARDGRHPRAAAAAAAPRASARLLLYGHPGGAHAAGRSSCSSLTAGRDRPARGVRRLARGGDPRAPVAQALRPAAAGLGRWRC